MVYIVRSSERLQPSANDNETKALLYLMSYREDSDEIFFFVVDFLNDLTGMNKRANKLWDLQSKGAKKSSPKAIGAELVTLYKNYISDFKFSHYILFLGGVTSTLRKNDKINSFGIENIKESAISNIKIGLKEECEKKEYIDISKATDENISAFLEEVHFVIDSESKSDYVKKIIKLNPSIIPEEDVLIAIFNEIRTAQSSKKSSFVVEGKKLKAPDEVINYGRHLTSSEIRMMVLNRIINQKVLTSNVTISFIDIYNKFPEESRKDMLERCQHDLARALFNVNQQEEFWMLFEDIYNNIVNNPKSTIEEIYRNLNEEMLDFDAISLKYFIAIIKDGMEL